MPNLFRQSALTVSALFFLNSLPAAAVPAGDSTSATFAGVRQVIDQAIAAKTPGEVLVVFDLDNTLMTTDRDIGSEHWFLWQADLLKTEPTNPALVASTTEQLLTVQGWIYTLTSMHATEPVIPGELKELAAQGVKFLVLTSRSLDVRDATQRELERNGLALATLAPGPDGGYAAPYLPYDPTQPEISGLTPDDVTRFGLNAPRPVLFDRGVFLTQGQHKGAMLKTLLAKTAATPAAIVFVDDRPHHLEGMQAAFADRVELVYTVRYTHEVEHVDAFKASTKADVESEWCAMSGGFRTGSPDKTPQDLPFHLCP